GTMDNSWKDVPEPKQLAILNPGMQYATWVEVYFEEEFLEGFWIKEQFGGATSLADILGGSLRDEQNTSPKSYVMDRDGEFAVRTWTGVPGHSDGSAQYQKAFLHNMSVAAYHYLAPYLDIKPNEDPECYTGFLARATETLVGQADLDSTRTMEALMASLPDLAFHAAADWVSTCDASWELHAEHFEAQAQLVAYTTALEVSGSMPWMAHQWKRAVPTEDRCFMVSGKVIEPCE
ncbi:MAG: hypothetical protein AAFV07_19870, partial [Bacteroidota bacterium]